MIGKSVRYAHSPNSSDRLEARTWPAFEAEPCRMNAGGPRYVFIYLHVSPNVSVVHVRACRRVPPRSISRTADQSADEETLLSGAERLNNRVSRLTDIAY